MFRRLVNNGKADDSNCCIKCFELKPYDDNDDLFGEHRWTFDYYNICDDCFEDLKDSYMNNSYYINFDGFNCNEVNDEDNECRGWDGESKRCECENRRVAWEYNKDYDMLYAQAY